MRLDAARIMPCKVKIGMIGHINQRLFVACHLIRNLKLIILCNSIGYLNILVAGKSHGAVRVRECKHDAVILRRCAPNSLVISLIIIAVKVVGAIVYRKLIGFSVYRKTRIVYAVRAWSYG